MPAAKSAKSWMDVAWKRSLINNYKQGLVGFLLNQSTGKRAQSRAREKQTKKKCHAREKKCQSRVTCSSKSQESELLVVSMIN